MSLDGHEVILQVAVRVRVAVRKVNRIVVMLEADVEGQCVRASFVLVVVQWTAAKKEEKEKQKRILIKTLNHVDADGGLLASLLLRGNWSFCSIDERSSTCAGWGWQMGT